MALHDWLPLATVAEHVSGDPADAPAGLDSARKAAAAQVERLRPDLFGVDGAGAQTFAGTDDVIEGAVLLTARIFARRQSPAGIANYGEFGAVPVLRFDSDVERLLGLGRYGRPRIG